MCIKPKKSIGQNFLIDQNIQKKIVLSCNFNSCDIVLEIGSGRGELTKLIAPLVSKIYAIEMDPHLSIILRDSFKEYPNTTIVNQDILKVNLKKYFGRIKKKIKIIGNIPYYITTPIIEHLLIYNKYIDAIFITVQKEFAKRIVAHPGSKDYGSLSCFLKYYTEAKILFHIKKTCFMPIPKVDSSFMQLDIKRDYSENVRDEKLLFKIIRAAFNQRRKTLRNSLAATMSLDRLNTFFKKYNIDCNCRPETLCLKDFINLANIC